MPTETKNSTANASRNGSDSWAARWLSGDSLRITPAKNAPSAKEMPNRLTAPNATPSAIASTASRNSSREPECAVQCSIHGMTRRPTKYITADERDELADGDAEGERKPLQVRGAASAPFPWPKAAAMPGSRTSASTVAKSSTISQPTATLPLSESMSRRSCKSAQQHHRARHAERETEDEAGAERPAERHAETGAEQRRDCDLRDARRAPRRGGPKAGR